MIVYTATDEISHKVYVGSARDNLEEHWISLVNQAEDGADGEFFAAIRQQGASQFEIEEFGFAEDSAEMRALMREAQKDLGAIPIKAGRASAANARVKAVSAKSELDELVSLNRDAGSWEDSLDSDDWKEELGKKVAAIENADKIAAEKPKPAPALSSMDLIKQALAEAAVETAATPVKKVAAAKSKSVAKKPQSDAIKLAVGRTGSAAKEKRIRESIQEEREAREQFRQTGSTAEAAEMKSLMMGIESRRLAARKTSKDARLVEAKKKAAADRKIAAAEKAAEASRLKGFKAAVDTNTGAGKTAGKSTAKAVVDEVEVKAPTKRSSRAEAKLLAAKVLSARAPKATPDVNSEKPSSLDPVVASPNVVSAKDQRIKNAIAAEKERLDAEKKARLSQENIDMAALLAGIDARGKTAEAVKRKR